MRLYVIRHGQKASSDPEYSGGSNSSLTAEGERQAKQLAESLAGEDIDSLYSSCQRRSLQTAAPVHQLIGSEWHVWPVFCETAKTQWVTRNTEDPETAAQVATWRVDEPIETSTREDRINKEEHGYLLSEIADEYPGVQLSQPFPWSDAWWKPLIGQTYITGFARVELGLEALLDRHEGGDHVAIVCHGNLGDKIVTSIMDFPRRRQRTRFSFHNTGITRLDRRDQGVWRIVYTNRTDHLSR